MGEEQQPDSGKEKTSGFPQLSAMHVVIIIGVIIVAAIVVGKFGFGMDLLSPSSGEMAIVKKPVTPAAPVTIKPPECGRFQARCGNVCTDIMSDPENCGSCGTVCPGTSTERKCSGGTCIKPCRAGYIDCNKNMTDGCEVNTLSDLNNCGDCGNVCRSESSCSLGECQPHLDGRTPIGDGVPPDGGPLYK